MDLTAFILAGGRSSRMGEDKAFLRLNGHTLLERVLERARQVTPQVHLVGAKEKLGKYVPVVEDIYPDRGPLGGIHAALTATATELNLVLAVDIPFISEQFLAFLVASAQRSEAQVTLPRVAGLWQPLCAVYRKKFVAVAEGALLAGHNKIDPLFSSVPVLTVEEGELRDQHFDPAMFDNLNSPADWEKARAR